MAPSLSIEEGSIDKGSIEEGPIEEGSLIPTTAAAIAPKDSPCRRAAPRAVPLWLAPPPGALGGGLGGGLALGEASASGVPPPPPLERP